MTTCWISLKFWSCFSLHCSKQSDRHLQSLLSIYCVSITLPTEYKLEYKAQSSALKELKYGSGDSTIITKQLNKWYLFIQLVDAITCSFCQQVFTKSYYTPNILLGVRTIAFNKTDFFSLHGACILLGDEDNKETGKYIVFRYTGSDIAWKKNEAV